MEIAITMVKIVVCMALGYFLNKIKILDSQVNTKLSALILNVTLPCTMFVAVAGMESRDMAAVWELIVIGFLIYIYLGIAAFIISKLIRMGKEKESVIQCLIMFGNVSFLGIPVTQALYGDTGVFYLAVLNVHFNIFCFTYGIWLMTRNNKSGSSFSPKKFLNPGLISIVAALIIYLCGISLPDALTQILEFIGQANSPLAMITIGSIIATYSLKELFSKWKFYVLSALKMLVLPAIAYLILYASIGPGLITNVATIYIAMPTANTVSMMAVNYNSDAKTATIGTGLMNILCIATIPMICLFMSMVG